VRSGGGGSLTNGGGNCPEAIGAAGVVARARTNP